jgi:DNA repair photolyase
MRIRYFHGELMTHPAPLELSMNRCSHDCAYCFANIKKSDRYFKVKSFVSSLSQGGIAGALLRGGYPTCISNNSDPFARSNQDASEFVIGEMQQRGYRMMFQTKGGERAYSILKGVAPSVVYVTVTTDSDDISRRIEPNAPCTSERIALIEQLVAAGHHVEVGLNPLASPWLPEDRAHRLVERLHAAGVSCFMVQNLHFNRKDVGALKPWRVEAMRDVDVRQYVGRGLRKSGELAYAQRLTLWGLKYGLHRTGFPYLTNTAEVYRKAYGDKFFPTLSQFVEKVIQAAERSGLPSGNICFEDFERAFLKDSVYDVEARGKELDGILIKLRPDAWRGRPENQNIKSYRRLFQIVWNDEKMWCSPARVGIIVAPLIHENGELARDEHGNLMLGYDAARPFGELLM